ncbi:two-component sensor histidine kinase [Vallitalea longa]|uniref:histidine kinase n=1 Tax=Vallitalea longa TaxID=2936439 RepID=A0A9W5YCD5_9FIRM|nr:HAMP domain-containing sensor histidine kinase [Vallitalea longa]GKX30524.1 two-component sensor histidine kinase [Vallitalea longa]
MIKYIKKEPYIYKRTKLSLIMMIAIIIMFYLVSSNMVKQLHKQKVIDDYNLIGGLIEVIPDEEQEIVSIFLEENSNQYVSTGKNILSKYGYTENMNMSYSKYFYDTVKKNMVMNIIILLFIFIILLIFFIKSIIYIMKKIELFSRGIDKVMDGDYSIHLSTDNEGIVDRIGHQFNLMSKRLSLSIEEIKKGREQIKSIVTDISHQFKTPLSSIKLFNSLMIEDEVDRENELKFLERTREEVNKLEWLVKSLVQISRLEAGMIQLNKQKSDIKKTILDAVNGIYLSASEKDININIENLISIDINHDRKWTKEAIFNLLENGVKYTREGGSINIAMEKLETSIKIVIKDTGIGIPKKEQFKVFNRFYRGESSEVQKKEGSGVGLYLTKRIIEDQGGTIAVRSTEGRGTTFTVLFFLTDL